MAFSAAQAQVATALKEVECPDTVKQMLLTSLPNVFGENLHQYQKEIAAMIRNSLETARTSAAQTQDSIVKQVEEDRAAMDSFQADVDRSQVAEDAARAFLDEKVADLDKTKAEVKAEEELCEKAVAKKDIVEEEKNRLQIARAEVESVKDGSLQMLVSGGWEDDEIRDACIDAVCNYLREDGGDVVLLAALPKALAKRERGPFDNIAIEEADRVMSEKLSGLVAELAAGAEKWDDATAEHLGAWAICDCARDQERAATEARDSADSALQTAIENKKLAAAKAVEHEAGLNTKLSEATLLESKVQQLDLALTSLAQLESGEALKADAAMADAVMAAEKESKEAAMVVDKENQGNNMAVDTEPTKQDALAVEQTPVDVVM